MTDRNWIPDGRPWREVPGFWDPPVRNLDNPADRMLAELDAFRIPADWRRRAAEYVAPLTGETVGAVLTRWANRDPVPPRKESHK